MKKKEAVPLSDVKSDYQDALENYMQKAALLAIQAASTVQLLDDLQTPGIKPLRDLLKKAVDEFNAAR